MQNTEVTIDNLLTMIGKLTVENDLLRSRITIIQSELNAERKEHVDNLPYSEPVRVPRRPPDGERM